jgi:hypothetical protein
MTDEEVAALHNARGLERDLVRWTPEVGHGGHDSLQWDPDGHSSSTDEVCTLALYARVCVY